MNEIAEPTDNEELNIKLKDEKYIKEFSNYVIFEGMTKLEAWTTTFDVSLPITNSMQTKLYRWIKKDAVQKWLIKANKTLEVDWIDKRVNALQHLYSIGTDKDNSEKAQIDALDRFLTHLNKEENKIKLDLGNSQVNIVQIVQEKLATITNGAIIQPSGQIKESTFASRADDAIDAIILKGKK